MAIRIMLTTITGTVIPTTMTIDAAKLMRLQGWLSPAFPIGAYSYSHGLERAVECGAVRDRPTLVDWLDADLRYGAGRTDGIFLAGSWRAMTGELHLPRSEESSSPAGFAAALSREGRGLLPPGEEEEISTTLTFGGEEAVLPPNILVIAELAAAMRGTSELALESRQQGTAFLIAVRKAWPHPLLDELADALRAGGVAAVLPVVAGMCCAAQGIPLELALPLYLHAGAANSINAAIRLIPLGQSDGQMALAALEAAIAETAAEAHNADIADVGSAAVMIDIASMQHETQYTRLFRS